MFAPSHILEKKDFRKQPFESILKKRGLSIVILLTWAIPNQAATLLALGVIENSERSTHTTLPKLSHNEHYSCLVKLFKRHRLASYVSNAILQLATDLLLPID